MKSKLQIVTFTFFSFFLIINSNLVFSSVVINEIMYNPSGSDNGHEWIEIYSDLPVNLSSWKFFEANTNHGLTLINGSYIVNGYAVITDEYDTFLIDYPEYNGTLFDSSWSSLSNTGEYLAIKNSSLDIIDFVNYSSIYANGNGKSLERFGLNWNDSGVNSGSPGKENNITNSIVCVSNGLELNVNLDDILYVGIDYTNLFRINNLDHVSGVTSCIDLTYIYNITKSGDLIVSDNVDLIGLNSYKTSNTGNFFPSEPGNYTISGLIVSSTVNDTNTIDDFDSKVINVIDTTNISCNILLNITIDKEIYDEKETVKINLELNNETFPYKIEYFIEDFFSNVYKNKYNTTNTNQKSWKTNIVEQDRVLFVKGIVYPICNDVNLTDNSYSKMFIVKSDSSNSVNSNSDSSLEIVDVDSKVKFGESINVDVSIYKGDTNRYSISLYVEKAGKKVSEITKIHIDDKYSSFNGQLPIQLKSNCDLKYGNGKYYVIIDGLSLEDKQSIEIEGINEKNCVNGKFDTTNNQKTTLNNCDTSKIKTVYIEKNSEDQFEYNIINKLICKDQENKQKIIYESKNEKIKQIIPYFISLFFS
jgi:hypothetical protein